MNKTVHIISHSHWDREWYMPFEQHNQRLVTLIDEILELIKTDPHYHSFHLDGQTILIDDYLKIRPEKKEELAATIQAGKIQIGPFYILQDAFLTSSESNTRNMLVGMKESKKWGQPVQLGYFPDTFGNMGQTPQMMQQAGLEHVAFGRGVKAIGFDNQVLQDDAFTSQYSEMLWKGPDGSEVLGLLFANWYSNGNEIPTDPELAKKFWDQKLADVEAYASTNHLLMMNGVDHQPAQLDITEAIKVANELYPDYTFIHSSFMDYLTAIEEEKNELGYVEGELKSQETDGWYTLANTASSRIYLKQWNTKVARMLENQAEPLAAMAYEVTGKYPHDELLYTWKRYMQNHPHDSICGCSVDEVHRGMMTRFEDAYEAGKFIADEALDQLATAIDASSFPENSYPFVVFNTTDVARDGMASVHVEIEREVFGEDLPPNKIYANLSAKENEVFHVVDQEGNPVDATIHSVKVGFNYDLPKDAFRIPYMERFVEVGIPTQDLAPFSWTTFALVPGESTHSTMSSESMIFEEGYVIENEHITLRILEDGSLSLYDKQTDTLLTDLLVFENMGDIGNEYIFKSPVGDKPLLSTEFPYEVNIILDTPLTAKIELIHHMEIPVSADELLELEQRSVTEFRQRKAQRSENTAPFKISTTITIHKESRHVDFETKFNNQMKDHRLRVLFPTKIFSDYNIADSIFEAVRRPNTVSKYWENPTNPQQQHAYVSLQSELYEVTVNNFGLNEYEIIDDTIAITLLRSTGELGDWGYFPTPEAQCLGETSVQYGIQIHSKEERYTVYRQAQARQVPYSTIQIYNRDGILPSSHRYLQIQGESFSITALKRNDETNNLVLRGYNLADKEEALVLKYHQKHPSHKLNLLEEVQTQPISNKLKPYEILTVQFEK